MAALPSNEAVKQDIRSSLPCGIWCKQLPYALISCRMAFADKGSCELTGGGGGAALGSWALLPSRMQCLALRALPPADGIQKSGRRVLTCTHMHLNKMLRQSIH